MKIKTLIFCSLSLTSMRILIFKILYSIQTCVTTKKPQKTMSIVVLFYYIFILSICFNIIPVHFEEVSSITAWQLILQKIGKCIDLNTMCWLLLSTFCSSNSYHIILLTSQMWWMDERKYTFQLLWSWGELGHKNITELSPDTSP